MATTDNEALNLSEFLRDAFAPFASNNIPTGRKRYVGGSMIPLPNDGREIGIGESVLLYGASIPNYSSTVDSLYGIPIKIVEKFDAIPDGTRAIVTASESGSRILAYHCRLKDGRVVRVRSDQLEPVGNP